MIQFSDNDSIGSSHRWSDSIKNGGVTYKHRAGNDSLVGSAGPENLPIYTLNSKKWTIKYKNSKYSMAIKSFFSWNSPWTQHFCCVQYNPANGKMVPERCQSEQTGL